MKILLLLLVLALGLVRLGRWLIAMPVPSWDGRLEVKGLVEPVDIYRDRHGVPHIFATSVRDAAFAQGFVQARDRLWQMELNRRVGCGRLSELFGGQALAADRFLRRMGLRRAAERQVDTLSDTERELLAAYADGVNAGTRSLGLRLPLEFWLLRLRPEPWSVVDSLTWINVMSMDLCANWEAELMRGRMAVRLPPQAAQLLTLSSPGRPVTIGESFGPSMERLAELYRQARDWLPQGLAGGSNVWAVSGSRSHSGKPLLASDPHLVARLPAIWHEAHLAAPGLDVFGACFVGLPLVVIGHNRKVAWGFTNSFADAEDLFLEKFDQDGHYLTEEGWKQPERRFETIRVRGGQPVIEEVVSTRHGPVLARDGEFGLALCSVTEEPDHIIDALLAANRAETAPAFREALRGWHAPSVNAVFADVEGNIGAMMTGLVPIRRRGTGLTPVPGWTGEYDWDGFIPFEEMPALMNPESGVLVNANNAIVGSRYPYHLTWDFMGGDRAARLVELLSSQETFTPQDFARFQTDTVTLPGRRFARLCTALAPSRARDLLLDWDGDLTPESAGGAVYEVTLHELMQLTFEPLLGPELLAEFMGRSPNPMAILAGHGGRYTGFLVDLVEQGDEALGRLGLTGGWHERLQQALDRAAERLTKELGDDWSWGRLHRLRLAHPLGLLKPLDRLFNGPEIPMGGDTDTPLQTPVIPHRPFSADSWSPSWRQVVDLGDTSRGASVLSTGQSGHPGSLHYLDQFPLWRSGALKEHLMNREDVEASSVSHMLLTPL